MKAWSLFHPFVLMDVMGAPDPVVNQALCLSAREFCQRTRVWTEWQDPVEPTPASNQYDFDVSSTVELVKVMRAISGTTELDVKSANQLPPDWQDTASTAFCDTLVCLDTSSYLVYPNTAAVLLELAFKPSLTATNCGDILFDRWAEEIASGAKARLLMAPAADYFNASLAAVHKGLFERGVHSAANTGWAQRSASEQRTTKAVV